MTYFPKATTLTTVRVAQYREALRFAENSANRIEYSSCRWDEVIQERSTGFLSLFRAMRELQSMKCPRASQDDKNRYASVMAKANRMMQQHGSEYFETFEGLSINQTDEEIHWNWIGSRMADALTYLRSPQEYPAQYARVVASLQPKTVKKRHLQVV
ncbi:hypothetical protein HRE53_30385 (plasmid) [Acaryochloris sp. 'Moss Beach']|uniref:hypothetical protein n=1 Tax=Acaryochloris sp. 'Moss Beach' TaxID=2740837 RepID=UPI001F2362AF|nr:hypothetical protein [Acaryochloris sp. 'Moss Beach']UJB72907.1 hypothetical protein HRE53_30385 [Acaryochloris sp. 'Moss Beach']